MSRSFVTAIYTAVFFSFAFGSGCPGPATGDDGGGEDCAVGSDACDCTEGGGCDQGLVCIDDQCSADSIVDAGDDGGPPCDTGSLGCSCTPSGGCETGLECNGGTCSEAIEDAGFTDSGPISCQVGSEGCSCTPGGGCDPGLQCDTGTDTCDSQAEADAGLVDAGTDDAGTNDAGTNDAGANDAGTNDAGASDAGTNDAGASDAGTNDAGATDAGTSDAGTNDAGTNDAGTNDAGTNDAGAEPCEAILVGNLTVENSLDLELLEAYCEVSGDLTFEFPGVPDLSDLQLRRVGGTFSIQITDATPSEFDLRHLESVGGTFEIFIAGDVPSVINLSQLESVGGSFEIRSGPLEVDLPRLQTVAGSLVLTGTAIEAIRLPVLRQAGGLRVSGTFIDELEVPALETVNRLSVIAGLLTTLAFDSLTSATGVRIERMYSLNTMSFPLLEHTNDFLLLSSPELTTINLPVFSASGRLKINTFDDVSSSLATLNLPMFADCLTREGLDLDDRGLFITGNPALTSLELPALTDCAQLQIENTGLVEFSAPDVTELVGGFAISENGALESISLPNLGSGPANGGTVALVDNPVLNTVDVNALVPRTGFVVFDLFILNNPNLPQCVVDDIVEGMGVSCLCASNGPPGTCE